ncbi:MAG: YgiT-type zinc finger domain-containing protein [Candidatus Latescibacterota bacterium]|jgi:YgiT-type zinc finger domain-containing protein
MVKCPVCQNHMIRTTIRYTQEWNDKLVAFDNVPADVCETCGEQVLEGHIVDKINQTLSSMEPPDKQLKVPLYDLAIT